MNFLRDLFKSKDKKNQTNLIMIFILGVVLLISSNFFYKNGFADKNTKVEDKSNTQSSTSVVPTQSYESSLEKRLEDSLSLVEGAGNVKVMLTLSYGREIVVAEDTVSKESGNKETDEKGGTREQYDRSVDGKKIIITSKSGVDNPLILKEIEPKIEGVIIVAQGGDNIYVKDSLIRAAEIVLGVEPHKVQVLKMK